MARRRKRKKKDKQKPDKAGGIAFFLSLVFLLLLALINCIALPALWDNTARYHLMRFGMGVAIGAWAASYLIRGRTSVLCHEFKHAFISGLVGNKWKGMHIEKDSGHFKYAYSKRTAEYNAFIQLAPYWLPLFTVPILVASLPFFYQTHSVIVIFVGIGWGIDLVMNMRDISPIQTDITDIRGGYKIGVLYIIAMNLVLTSILLAWIFQGVFGLTFLMRALWEFCLYMVAYYRSI